MEDNNQRNNFTPYITEGSDNPLIYSIRHRPRLRPRPDFVVIVDHKNQYIKVECSWEKHRDDTVVLHTHLHSFH